MLEKIFLNQRFVLDGIQFALMHSFRAEGVIIVPEGKSMRFNKKFALTSLLMVSGLGISVGAHADSTYQFGQNGSAPSTTPLPGNPTPNTTGVTETTTAARSGDAANLTSAVGFAAANGGLWANDSATNYGIAGFKTGTGQTWTGATWTANALAAYPGLGMSSDSATSSTAPNHALDNGPATDANGARYALGNTEAVMMSFSNSVALTSVDFSYGSGDTDFSLFRYVGNGSAPSLSGVKIDNTQTSMLTAMANAGWQLVGNYDGAQGATQSTEFDPAAQTVNTTGLASSWWLVSAYNTSYGSVSKNGGSLDQGDDYFKLYQVSAYKSSNTGVNGVPEPGSLALVSLGLVGMLAHKRRRSRADTKLA